MSVSPVGRSTVSGPVTWTFTVDPNGQTFQVSVQSDNPFITFKTTTSGAIQSATPPTQIGFSTSFASQRGCRGTMVVAGEAASRTIDAQVAGDECGDTTDRTPFTGRATLTKQ